jgi:hypothetical protein
VQQLIQVMGTIHHLVRGGVIEFLEHLCEVV